MPTPEHSFPGADFFQPAFSQLAFLADLPGWVWALGLVGILIVAGFILANRDVSGTDDTSIPANDSTGGPHIASHNTEESLAAAAIAMQSGPGMGAAPAPAAILASEAVSHKPAAPPREGPGEETAAAESPAK